MVKTKDFKEKKDIKSPVNALPEYKIRTMKDDLLELGVKKIGKKPVSGTTKKAAPPEKLPVIPSPPAPKIRPAKAPSKAPLPGTEELITEKVEKLPKPPKPKIEKPLVIPSKPKRKSKLLIILLIIILILLGIGLFFYWQGKKTISPPPSPPPAAEEEKPVLSDPLMPVDETKTISLKPDESLFQLLKEETKLDQPIGTFKRIAVLNPSIKGEKEFLSLSEFLKRLEISSPPYIAAELEEDYTFIIFSQKTGKRWALLIKIKNPDNLKEQMGFWEETMLEDFKNFYPDQAPGQPASQTFLDDIHQEVAIRYLNLPFSTLTINYALINHLLIIGTSKETMYRAIDRILK